MVRLALFVLLCLAALCFPVIAYADESSYTVTIPAEVSVDASSQSTSLQVEGALSEKQELDISISSANSFQLKCGSYGLPYALSGNDYSNGRMRFASPNGPRSFNSTLNVALSGGQTPPVSGTYEDKLTFSYSCSSARSLSLDANGGSFSSGFNTYTESVKVGSTYGQLPTPSWEGHVFDGWYTSVSGGVAIDPETAVMGEDDTSLYAHWHESTLTIKYWNDGAQSWRSYHSNQYTSVDADALVETEAVLYSGNYVHSEYGILDVDRFHRDGYRSGNKWRIGSKESEQTVSDTNWDGYGSGAEAKGFYVADKLGVLEQLKSSDVTVDLYPVFLANNYTVVYDGNGGSGSMSRSRYTYDQVGTLNLNAFQQDGYEFVGWNTNQDGTGISYEDGAKVKNLATKNDATVTLYAQWRQVAQSSASEAELDGVQAESAE